MDLYVWKSIKGEFFSDLSYRPVRSEIHNRSIPLPNDTFASFRCSELWGCKRKIYLSRTNIPRRPVSIESRIKMMLGTQAHRYIQERLSSFKYKIETELTDTFNFTGKIIGITGHSDILMKSPFGNILIDIKSVHPFTMSKITKAVKAAENLDGFGLASVFSEWYWPQLDLYSKMQNADFFGVLYVDRGSGRMELVTEKVDERERAHRIDEYEKKMKEIVNDFIKREIPEKDPQQSWECKSCPFSESCKSIEEYPEYNDEIIPRPGLNPPVDD